MTLTKVEEALGELERNHSGTDCQNAASSERVRALVVAAKAELARLKPSGQVAEDLEKVRAYAFPADEVPFAGDVEAALDHLAAKAQGYEAAVADNAARKRVGAMMANACFNLSQREHLRPDERQTLDELRRAWDALGAHPSATHTATGAVEWGGLKPTAS